MRVRKKSVNNHMMLRPELKEMLEENKKLRLWVDDKWTEIGLVIHLDQIESDPFRSKCALCQNGICTYEKWKIFYRRHTRSNRWTMKMKASWKQNDGILLVNRMLRKMHHYFSSYKRFGTFVDYDAKWKRCVDVCVLCWQSGRSPSRHQFSSEHVEPVLGVRSKAFAWQSHCATVKMRSQQIYHTTIYI